LKVIREPFGKEMKSMTPFFRQAISHFSRIGLGMKWRIFS